MAVFTSMYDPMNKDKEKLMNENEELLKDREKANELLCLVLSKLKDRKALSYIQS